VFQIDIERCEQCGGKVKIKALRHPRRGIASIEDLVTIHRILDHLDRKARGPPTVIRIARAE